MSDYIVAIDHGTTSTRCMVFDHAGTVIAVDQLEHDQLFPQAGWVEHDATQIWRNTRLVIDGALTRAGIEAGAVAALGIANQRETTVVWDRHTGIPVCPAIVWQDTRTQAICDQLAALGGGAARYQQRVGLPLATYFAGPKIRWILDNVSGARQSAIAGDLLFGTTDTWLIWQLTGGIDGGIHVTDVTNASRTMLMDLQTLNWDLDIAAEFGIPVSMLPRIVSSSEVYGQARGTLAGVPIAAALGDQQAATFGQACFEPGTAKNTYGTGNFLLLNTGTTPMTSTHGLLTTVCYQLGPQPAVYALEGSIAVTGSLVQWLRDNLGLISTAAEIETLAASVPDSGGAFIVPAFSGLFAPYWRSDARGAIVGLTRFVTKAHLARATLEAVGYQTREVVEAMRADSGVGLHELKVDGGMVGNHLLMQIQADILDVTVVRPRVAETTALGAAYAAGLAVGYWGGVDDVRGNWAEGGRWTPSMSSEDRERGYRSWLKAVTRTFDWVDAET